MGKQPVGVVHRIRGIEMSQNRCSSYLGYSVSEDGSVFTHRKRYGKGQGNGGGVKIDWGYIRKLNSYRGHGGYWYVSVSTEQGQRSIPVHTMLMDAFVGPCPDGYEVRHLDGNPENNNLENLKYGTRQENAADRVRHGSQPRGESHGRAKLTRNDIKAVRAKHSDGATIASIARQYAMAESTIGDIVKKRRWKHIE